MGLGHILKAYCEVIRMYIPHTRHENKKSLYNKGINNYNNSSLDTQYFSMLFLNWWNNKSYSKNFKMKRTLLKKLRELQWYTFVTYDMCSVFMKWNYRDTHFAMKATITIFIFKIMLWFIKLYLLVCCTVIFLKQKYDTYRHTVFM